MAAFGGPFAATIVAAIRRLLASDNTWTGTNTFSTPPTGVITFQYAAPLTGSTIAFTNSPYTQLFINPAGTIATLTLTLPASPADGTYMAFSSVQTITTLTLNGNGHTVVNTPTTLNGGTAGLKYMYSATAGSWLRCT